ncbi:MAG: hypothetical protein AAB036_09395 [Elusimicrobiota bacterium]|mgnify:CR=1 FL=1
MRSAIFLISALTLSSCVAETVERRRPRLGPVAAVGFVDHGGGRVRYSLDGWSWFVSGRRRHALRLMHKNCGKKLDAQVTDEYPRQDANISYAGDDITLNMDKGVEHYRIEPFQHMTYECRPKSPPPQDPKQ